MSETLQTVSEAPAPSPFLAQEKARARAWDAIKTRADPMVVREALETLPVSDRLRVADEIAEGLQTRASKTGDYAEMERVMPYLPGQAPLERRSLETAVSTAPEVASVPSAPAVSTRPPAPLPLDDPRYRAMTFARQNVEDGYRLAHTLGVVAPIEALAAERLVAREIVERLGPALDRVGELASLNGEGHAAQKDKEDLVRAVRAKLDIPSLDDRTAFETWRASRGHAPDPSAVPAPAVEPVAVQAGPPPAPPGLSPDARIVQQALDTIVTARHPRHADELKAHIAQALQNREMVLGVIDLPAETRVLAGKAPTHTLDEMREVAALVRARAATPEDRAVPSPALAELRQSLEDQARGKGTFRDLTRLYGEADIGRSIAAVSADPVEGPKLAASLDALERRLLDEERARQGIGRGDAPSPTRPRMETETETAPSRAQAAARSIDDASTAAPGFSFAAGGRRSDRAQDHAAHAAAVTVEGYTVRDRAGAQEYVQVESGKVAFRATAERIEGVLRDRGTVGDMLDVARARGWTTVRVEGDREVARLAWIEASARGLGVEGYRPTLDDRHALDQRRLERRDQGHEVPEMAPRRGVASDATDRPQDGRQNQPEATSPPQRAATAREGRLARDAWATATGGYDALKPQQQEHAQRAYQTWAAAQPDKGEGFDLHRYVAHVQDKQAERRADRERRHTPPLERPQEVELPSRYTM